MALGGTRELHAPSATHALLAVLNPLRCCSSSAKQYSEGVHQSIVLASSYG